MNCPICGSTLLQANVSLSGQSWRFYLCPKKCFIDYFPAAESEENIKRDWAKKNPKLRLR